MLAAKEQFSQYLHRRYGDRSTPKHYSSDLEMFIHSKSDPNRRQQSRPRMWTNL